MTLTLYQAWNQFYKNFSENKPIGKTDFGFWSNHIEPYFPDCPLSSITTKTILDYRSYIEAKGLSPQTVHHCLALLKRVFNKMRLLESYFGKIPCFIMPSFDNQRIRFLTQHEISLLFSIIKSKSELWYAISIFALNTGMRASEIFKLKGYNINLELSQIYVLDTKSSANRVVPLNRNSRQVIEKFYTRPGNYIFENKNQQQIKEAGKAFFRSVEQSGLNTGITDRRQKIVFHSLRHTFASWLVQRKVPLEVVGKLLGHKTLQMTQRYAHIASEQQSQAVQVLDFQSLDFL
jgi:integrase